MNLMAYFGFSIMLAMFGLFVQARRHDDMVKRIVGGKESPPNKWPWQALILQLKDDGKTYRQKCGGALIHPEWIVTTAVCVFNVEPSELKIVLGEHARDEIEGQEQEFHVAYFQLNSRVLADVEYGFNIALVRLSSSAKITEAVQPISLPKLYEQVPVGKKCYMVGWGATEYKGERSNVLRQVEIPVVSYEDCKRNEALYSKVDKFSMLCAGYGDSKTPISGCDGDAGGSFACKEGSKWVLQGVISWGDAKCGGYYYSIMTRISSFIDWIEYKMKAPPLQKPSTCTDAHYYCQEWKAKGWCNVKFFKHMLQGYYCKKTCGAC